MKIEQSAIFAVNKPKGITSNKLLQTIRHSFGIKKIGHAGTLDPLASGILVVGTGSATRQLANVVRKEKEYLATIILGQSSTTDDEEGEKTVWLSNKQSTEQQIKKLLTKFKGQIWQTPPHYSAIKIKGKEAYKRIRAGEKFAMEPRPVEIKAIKLLDFQWPTVRLQVVTGPGVYIRALARDIGEQLGVGGYLGDLVRTRVGDFKLENSIDYQELMSTNQIR